MPRGDKVFQILLRSRRKEREVDETEYKKTNNRFDAQGVGFFKFDPALSAQNLFQCL